MFTVTAYESDSDGCSHLALVKGEVAGDDPVLVRVHSECLTGDVLGSLRCDCGGQLQAAMRMVGREGRGRGAVHAPGRPGHRPDQQDQGLLPSGQGNGHRGGQPGVGVQERPARLRRGSANAGGPGRAPNAPDDQQPQENRWVGRIRPGRGGTGAHRDGPPDWTTNATCSPKKKRWDICSPSKKTRDNPRRGNDMAQTHTQASGPWKADSTPRDSNSPSWPAGSTTSSWTSSCPARWIICCATGPRRKTSPLSARPGPLSCPWWPRGPRRAASSTAWSAWARVIRGATPHFDYVAARGGQGAGPGGPGHRRAGGLRRAHHGHPGAGHRTRRKQGGEQGRGRGRGHPGNHPGPGAIGLTGRSKMYDCCVASKKPNPRVG